MTLKSCDPHKALVGLFKDTTPDHIAVAVSGGSDSLALLTLAKEWRDAGGPKVSAVTVDHGLRCEAAEEAAGVADICTKLDVPHTILNWVRPKGGGNLHDQARRGRYALMAKWAAVAGIGTIAVGHTLDDQAETFLMRLSRGAGVDGLAAMRNTWEQDGVRFCRPLLSCRRDTLRDLLRDRGLKWVEDAANHDPAYDRSRVRAALPVLSDLGIEPDRLAEVSGYLAQACDSLQDAMIEAARSMARVELGDVVINHAQFVDLSPELARRMLLAAMRWISGAEYPPRGAALTAAIKALLQGDPVVLQGCDARVSKGAIQITREAGAVADVTCKLSEIWDGRWKIDGPQLGNARIAALTEAGLAHCPDRHASPLPARSLMASPAVWQGDTLLAAPLAGLTNGWTAHLVPREEHDFAAEITH